MLDVTAFKGFLYDTALSGPLDGVITPPYDVISAEDRARLAAMSPYNLAHLILPQGDGARSKYDAAGAAIESWIAAGVLRQDPEPCFYLLRQTFRDDLGEERVRRGFFRRGAPSGSG